MDWPTFESNLRMLINDDSTKQKYTSEQLLAVANDVRGVLAEDIELVTVNSSPATLEMYPLGNFFLRVIRVEYEENGVTTLLKDFWQSNVPTFQLQSGRPSYYFLNRPEFGYFQINGSDLGGTVNLVYSRVPLEFKNDGTDLDIDLQKPYQYRALAYLIAHYIFAGESANRAQLMQWGQRPDLNVGNPLMDISEWFLKRYNDLISRYATWRRR